MKKTFLLVTLIALASCKKEEVKEESQTLNFVCKCDEVQWSRIAIEEPWTVDYYIEPWEVNCDSTQFYEYSYYSEDSLVSRAVDCNYYLSQ
jgi:hypothetical protein